MVNQSHVAIRNRLLHVFLENHGFVGVNADNESVIYQRAKSSFTSCTVDRVTIYFRKPLQARIEVIHETIRDSDRSFNWRREEIINLNSQDAMLRMMQAAELNHYTPKQEQRRV